MGSSRALALAAAPHRRPLPALLLTAATAATAAIGYGALWERNAFTLRRADVPILAPGSRPLRLLHISDVHMLGRQQRKQAWIRDLARLLPDLVVSTGDHLSADDGIPAVLDAFAPLLDRPGAFVLGSNDYFAAMPRNPMRYVSPNRRRSPGPALAWKDLVAGFTAAGWHDLDNAQTTVRVDGRTVALRGVDDPHLHRDDYAAIHPVPRSGDGVDVRIGVVHAPEPRVLDWFAADADQLILCGHTHGGQLRLPGVGALVTNCGLDRARCRGLSRYANSWLHVSAGLGTSPYAPVRFACRPEATLLTLIAGEPSREVR